MFHGRGDVTRIRLHTVRGVIVSSERAGQPILSEHTETETTALLRTIAQRKLISIILKKVTRPSKLGTWIQMKCRRYGGQEVI